MRVIVTGGAGFIGSALCRDLVGTRGYTVVNVDKLTYAANLASLEPVEHHPNYHFIKADICDRAAMDAIFAAVRPDAVMHLAAESHVDRSITGSAAFIATNITGTHVLLEAARGYWQRLTPEASERFRFLHVSTDEVFGSLPPGAYFTEESPYDPRSPYSASKAASDHLVRAWHETYGLPVLITNCSNNYGPCQFPEKLIPLTILNALEERPLPIYGDGRQVRDWLHVEDHVTALTRVLERGHVGQTYIIGGRAPMENIDVVEHICELVDARRPAAQPRRRLMTFVADRPGHDRRYAIDPTRIESELGWRARETFVSGLARTVDWYLANEAWWRPMREGVYQGQRLGLIESEITAATERLRTGTTG